MRLLLVVHAAMPEPGTAAAGGDLPVAAAARVAALGRMLPRPRAAFTSPAPAARQTAAALGLDAAVEAALADRGAGEAEDDLLGRVDAWLEVQREAEGTRAAVTHAAVVRAAIAAALGIPPDAAGRIDVAPLAVTDLIRQAGRWRLAHVNWEPALIHVPQRRARRRPASGHAH